MKPSLELLRLLPDLEALAARADPEAMLFGYFGAGDEGMPASFGGASGVGREIEVPESEESELPTTDLIPAGLQDERLHVLEAGHRALLKVRAQGVDADLSPAENTGLETIVLLEGRPPCSSVATISSLCRRSGRSSTTIRTVLSPQPRALGASSWKATHPLIGSAPASW